MRMATPRTTAFPSAFACATLSLVALILPMNPLAARTDQHAAEALFVAVHGAADRPVPSARIEIDSEGKPFKLDVVSKQDGTYTGPELAPGRYRIVVTAHCYETFEGSFEVSAGRTASTTISLAPAARATGCAATGFEYTDSTSLKAGEIEGAVDAAGYSSQAEARSEDLRQALAAIVSGGGDNKTGSESDILRRGNDLLLQGRYQQAAGVFRGAAERYPQSVNALLGSGVAYYAGGHYDEAAEALCKAVDLDPADPRPYFFLAQAAWSSPAEGAPVLHRLAANAKSHPGDATAQYYYAVALLRDQNVGENGIDAREPERLLRSATALDDSLSEAHFELGVVLSPSHPADAIAEFQRVIALRPDWAEAHYRLGLLYQHSGTGDKAKNELAEYDRLHKRGPVEEVERLRDEIQKLLGRESSSQGLGARN